MKITKDKDYITLTKLGYSVDLYNVTKVISGSEETHDRIAIMFNYDMGKINEKVPFKIYHDMPITNKEMIKTISDALEIAERDFKQLVGRF